MEKEVADIVNEEIDVDKIGELDESSSKAK